MLPANPCECTSACAAERNYCRGAPSIAQSIRAEERHESSAQCVSFSRVVLLLSFNLFYCACFLLLLSLDEVCELSSLLIFDQSWMVINLYNEFNWCSGSFYF